MTRVKICGIRSEEQALAAARAGADFIGLVFADSPRRVSPARAKKIVAALKNGHAHVEAVGVFVNTPAYEVNRIAETCRLDRVQLSGDEDADYCRTIDRPIIKAVRPGALASDKPLFEWKDAVILLDTAVPEHYGGTGLTFDWSLAVPIARKYPVILAGGLTPENVAGAIRTVRPWGVDVSSGVETNGVKDMTKIEKFIQAVREADAIPA
jgi:phosphoribosylanthranilate isomerase